MTDPLREAAELRVAYLLRLADALEARGIVLCGVAALEIRAMAEGTVCPSIRVSPDAQTSAQDDDAHMR